MNTTGGCGEAFCDDDVTPFAQGRAIGRDVPDSEGSLMASYSVYVVDPGAAPRNLRSLFFSFFFSSFSPLVSSRHFTLIRNVTSGWKRPFVASTR